MTRENDLIRDARRHISWLISALRDVPGSPYIDELEAVRRELSNGDVDTALLLCAEIPWISNERSSIKGLLLYEMRHHSVARHSAAVALTLARLSLQSGSLPDDPPNPATESRPAPRPEAGTRRSHSEVLYWRDLQARFSRRRQG